MKELTLLNFSEVYPDEGTCVEALRRFHEEHGLSCSRCGCRHQYWDKAHKSWICSRCGHETTLRSGTVMQGSNLKSSGNWAASVTSPYGKWCTSSVT